MDLNPPRAGYADTYYARAIAARAPLPHPVLEGDTQSDVCIIGGGLAGINTALALMQRGLSVTVLEQHCFGWGASGRNGGFVARGYAAGPDEIAARTDIETARALMALTRDARALIKQRITDFNIDCGPLKYGVLTVSWKDRPESVRAYTDRMNRDYNAGLDYWDTDRVRAACKTEKYFQGYYSPDDFQFDSLRYIHGLADVLKMGGVSLHENTPVTSIEKSAEEWVVRSTGGSVRARHVVLCCSGLYRRTRSAAL